MVDVQGLFRPKLEAHVQNHLPPSQKTSLGS